MDSSSMETALKYLIDRLDPDAKDELKQLLGGDIPTIGEDVKGGRISMDKLPDRMKRQFVAGLRNTPDMLAQDRAAAKGFEDRFPHANRLR